MQIYYEIWASITDEARTKILTKSTRFLPDGIPFGALVFEVITSIVLINTRAASTQVRKRLANLDWYMTTIGCSICKLNMYVKTQRVLLHHRGKDLQDIFTYMFEPMK